MMKSVTICIVFFLISSAAGGPFSKHSSRIVGGQPTTAGQFPFVVQLNWNGYFRCAGFIYNRDYIITSALCVYGISSGAEVVVGQWDWNSVDPEEQVVSVSYIRVHENYDPVSYRNNIAVLKVSRSIVFGAYVDAIKIGQVDLSVTAFGTLVGWGSLSEGGSLQAKLLQTTFNMAPNNNCNGYGSFDPTSMICAGQGSDACQGDAGSPLIQVNPSFTTSTVTIPTSSTATTSQTTSTVITSTTTSQTASTTTTSPTTPTTPSSQTTSVTCVNPTGNPSTEPVPYSEEKRADDCTTSSSATSSITTRVTDPSSPTTEPLPRYDSGRVFDASIVVGIVSHNQGCNNYLYPTVFTNLQLYVGWLANIAGPQ